jgi:hypothetical protein
MKRHYIPFLAFLILLLLTIPFSFDFATSVVPGWHTTIFPPYFVWGISVVIFLLVATIGYWLLTKRADKISWTLFAFHSILTIPTLIYLKFPTIFLDVHQTNQEGIMKEIYLRIKLIPFSWALFIVGQILFIIYYIRTIISNQV